MTKLHACIARLRVTAKKVAEHEILLSEPVLVCLVLKRSDLNDASTALIMSQVGSKIAFQDMVDALETAFGQESMVKSRVATVLARREYRRL